MALEIDKSNERDNHMVHFVSECAGRVNIDFGIIMQENNK